MPGTKVGGAKAAASMKRLYGNDYYINVGKMGGKTPKKTPSGFASMTHERLVELGRKGGTISRKTKRPQGTPAKIGLWDRIFHRT